MRCVVTGGAGFIGSHLADAVVAQGASVTIVDRLLGAHTSNVDGARAAGARVIEADVTDVEAMMRAFDAARPEIVFHLAAQIDVRRSVADPSTDAHVDIGGTAAVLEAARHARTRRVLLASTARVYGHPVTTPTPEDADIAPLSPYGASKAAAETYMRLFARLHGVSTLSLRIANVYGPRQDPSVGSGVVAIFAAAASAGRPATIYGDGSQTRDYVFVDDVVAAFLAAAVAQVDGALNIGTGRPTSLRELAAILDLEPVDGPARAGELRHSCLDPGRAAKRSAGARQPRYLRACAAPSTPCCV